MAGTKRQDGAACCLQLVQGAVRSTVAASSAYQAAAGALAAGGGKAVEYMGAKVAKALSAGKEHITAVADCLGVKLSIKNWIAQGHECTCTPPSH